MKHLALPALLTAALLTPLAAYAGETEPADTTTVIKTDKRGDVSFEQGQRASAAARATTDIVRTTHVVDPSAQLVTTTVKVRDLSGAGSQLVAVLLEDANGEELGYAYGARGRRVVTAYSEGQDGDTTCKEGKIVTRWAKNEVVLLVPFACIGAPESARLRGATVTFARSAVLYDQAPRTRVVSVAAPVS